MLVDYQMISKAYFLPLVRNVNRKDLLYTIVCRIIGAGGYASVLSTVAFRAAFLQPHIAYQLRSSLNQVLINVFPGQKTLLEKRIQAVNIIFKAYEDISKECFRPLENEEIECVNPFLRTLSNDVLDSLESQIEHKLLLKFWILRSFVLLKDNEFIDNLYRKCLAADPKTKEYKEKFSYQEAAFLLMYHDLERLLMGLNVNCQNAEPLLKRLFGIERVNKVKEPMFEEIVSQFQEGDILLDDVPQKVALMGIHLRPELQRIYLTQGDEFHLGIFCQDENGMKENMMGMYGYTQKKLRPANLLPVSILRFKTEEMRKSLVDLSQKNPNSEIQGFADHCKAFMDLHEEPETNMLREVAFSKYESCASFVAKTIVNALYTNMPDLKNPFEGYDLRYITPNAIKKCLVQAGYVSVFQEPSAKTYKFLEG